MQHETLELIGITAQGPRFMELILLGTASEARALFQAPELLLSSCCWVSRAFERSPQWLEIPVFGPHLQSPRAGTCLGPDSSLARPRKEKIRILTSMVTSLAFPHGARKKDCHHLSLRCVNTMSMSGFRNIRIYHGQLK